MASASGVDLRKVPHRTLRFETIDECLSELKRIDEAEAYGRLTITGNWTAAQNLNHLAAWIEYGYSGYPIAAPPFFVRWILRWQLPSILKGHMPRGVRIPKVPGGTMGMDDGPFPEAVDRLRRAWTRLRDDSECPHDSPAFGKMSHADRIQLNLRHAELHMGYLQY